MVALDVARKFKALCEEAGLGENTRQYLLRGIEEEGMALVDAGRLEQADDAWKLQQIRAGTAPYVEVKNLQTFTDPYIQPPKPSTFLEGGQDTNTTERSDDEQR